MTDVAAQAAPADPAARRALVQEVAARLGETAAGPRQQLARVVDVLGAARARALLAETVAVEARGGLMVPDGRRQRTPGGVFFHLVRRGVDPDERRQIFPPGSQRPAGRGDAGAGGPAAPPRAAEPAFTWDDYPAAIADAGQQRGEATTVKITVIGRPARVVERGDVAVITLRSEKVPSLPKGLPAPAQPTDYAVLIARKPWQKVAQAAANPADLLIVEGVPTLDPRFAGITVLATNTTTKQLQQAARQRKQASAE